LANNSQGLAAAKEISFEADGREILRAILTHDNGKQKFALEKATTLSDSSDGSENLPRRAGLGAIGEIEGIDASGKTACFPSLDLSEGVAAEMLQQYRTIKEADPTRPVFMTLTGHFHPYFRR